jgi:hypothetical protein
MGDSPCVTFFDWVCSCRHCWHCCRSKMLLGATLSGKLTMIDADGDPKKFTVTYTYSTKSPNPDGQKQYKDIYANWVKAVQNKDKKGATKLAQDLQTARANTVMTTDVPIDFLLSADKDLKVRRQNPPPKDPGADGKTTPYTAGELQKLKGTGADATLVGYEASLKDLQKDQLVKVYLDRTKLAKKSEGDKPEAEVHPITMILILPKPTGTAMAKPKN